MAIPRVELHPSLSIRTNELFANFEALQKSERGLECSCYKLFFEILSCASAEDLGQPVLFGDRKISWPDWKGVSMWSSGFLDLQGHERKVSITTKEKVGNSEVSKIATIVFEDRFSERTRVWVEMVTPIQDESGKIPVRTLMKVSRPCLYEIGSFARNNDEINEPELVNKLEIILILLPIATEYVKAIKNSSDSS